MCLLQIKIINFDAPLFNVFRQNRIDLYNGSNDNHYYRGAFYVYRTRTEKGEDDNQADCSKK